jgi:hypothetical protein
MMVADIAINKISGEKIVMLIQSYMPAQSIHIVKNITNTQLSPWYSASTQEIVTPNWTFTQKQLKQ